MKPRLVAFVALSAILAATGCSSESAPGQDASSDLPQIVSMESPTGKSWTLDAFVNGRVSIKGGCFVLKSDDESSDTWLIMWPDGVERSNGDPRAVSVGQFEIHEGDVIQGHGGQVETKGDLPKAFANCDVADPSGYVQVSNILKSSPSS